MADTSKIRSRLKAVWPDLVYIWFTDREFEIPDDETGMEVIESALAVEMPKRNGHKLECEEYALLFHAEMIKQQVKLVSSLSWPVAEVIGTQFKDMGLVGSHVVNLMVTKNRVLLVDTENKKVWDADPESDDIFFAYFV